MNAVEGADEDAYQFNPCAVPALLLRIERDEIVDSVSVDHVGRAPGYAPVVDPCGQAGGKLKNQNIGGDSTFQTTKFATMGDLGSKLPPSENKTKWVAGTYVEVAWGPLYNHGGGTHTLTPAVPARACPSQPIPQRCHVPSA